MKTKALVLFSGGLDSRLAIKLLQDQNIDVEAVYIKLPFGKGCCTSFGCVLNFTQLQDAFGDFIEICQEATRRWKPSTGRCDHADNATRAPERSPSSLRRHAVSAATLRSPDRPDHAVGEGPRA